jgi:hypothetical protein
MLSTGLTRSRLASVLLVALTGLLLAVVPQIAAGGQQRAALRLSTVTLDAGSTPHITTTVATRSVVTPHSSEQPSQVAISSRRADSRWLSGSAPLAQRLAPILRSPLTAKPRGP